jgi:hypothetical protein
MRVVLALTITALAVAAVAVTQSRSAPGQAQAAPRAIQLVEAKVDHGVIRVTVKIRGWKMYPQLVGKKPKPDGGHWHIYVNGRYNNFSTSPTKGQTDPKKKLTPGSYKVYAALANNNHTLLKPSVKSKTVTVTVEEPAETTE